MSQPAPPEIRTFPETTLVGTVRDYTMDTRGEIPAQWQAFFAAGHDIPFAVPGAMYGASFSADGAGGFRYGIGCEVSELAHPLPEGTCEIRLSGGEYAVVSGFGPPGRDIPAAFDWLFAGWLPGSEFEQREGAVFERYPDDPRSGPDGVAFEIWAPVRRKA